MRIPIIVKRFVFYCLSWFGDIKTASKLRNSRLLRKLKPILLYISIKGEFLVTNGKINFRYYCTRLDRIGSIVFWKGLDGFEPETKDLLTKLLVKKSLFIDVGANTGIFSLIALSCGVQHVLAIEAEPRIFNALKKNLSLNSNPNHFTAKQVAASNTEGICNFHIPDSPVFDTSSSLHPKGFRGKKGHLIKVKVQKIDTLFQELLPKLQNPLQIVVKIDVEGFEYNVILGMKEMLLKFRPQIIFECHQDSPYKKIDKLLKKYNYEFYHMGKKRPNKSQKFGSYGGTKRRVEFLGKTKKD